MGNAQSGPAAEQQSERCYYEVLGVPQSATPDEIKRAYRRLALQWHPDKHPAEGREHATQVFAAIGAAYETLSDAQERAWYDRNRDALLRSNAPCAGPALDADALLPFFWRSAFKGFGAEATAFFGVYASVFGRIDDFEHAGPRGPRRDVPWGPRFGSRETPWADVAPFYAHWSSFCSTRDFSDAPAVARYAVSLARLRAEDRATRRHLERERTRAQAGLRAAFSERVRDLAAHVRKLDPRHREHVAAVAAARAHAEERRKEEARRQRAQAALSYAAPTWTDHGERQVNTISDDSGSGSDSEEGVFCEPCRRAFRNRQQWLSHERSRKHRATLLALGIDPDAVFIDGEDDEHSGDDPGHGSDSQSASGSGSGSGESGSDEEYAGSGESADLSPGESGGESEYSCGESDNAEGQSCGSDSGSYLSNGDSDLSVSGSDSLDSGYDTQCDRKTDTDGDTDESPHGDSSEESPVLDPAEALRRLEELEITRRRRAGGPRETQSAVAASSRDQPNAQPVPKKNARRARQKGEQTQQAAAHACARCRRSFPSRNKLFEHIKATGHAAYK